MKLQVYKFTGISPLLMSNIESVNRGLPQLKLGTKPNKGDVGKISEGMTYRDEKGNLYMPTQALRSSLLKGCTGQKFSGIRQGAKTLLQGLVFQAEDRATLLDVNGKPIKNVTPQVDSGVNKNSNDRIIIVRPRIEQWSMKVPFEIDDEFAPSNFEQFMDTLLTIWNRAGRAVGIGAWRPEKQGAFGRYSVEMV